MKIIFIVYDLNPTFKIQELTLLTRNKIRTIFLTSNMEKYFY